MVKFIKHINSTVSSPFFRSVCFRLKKNSKRDKSHGLSLFFFLEDEKDVGFIQFYFDRISSNEHQSRNSSSNRYRCDTFDQSVIIAKHIQRAQQMFHEEAFIYRSNNRHEH